MSASVGKDLRRPLSALLSQALIAFTIELDNEFELRMSKRSYPGARLSLFAWSNLIRFIREPGVTVGNLAVQALAAQEEIKHQLGCLERWRFITLAATNPSRTGPARRPGWGSGRGIRADWMVRLTPIGQIASKVWPPLPDEIEQRWISRVGDNEIGRLKQTLQSIVASFALELPDGLPNRQMRATPFPPRVTRRKDGLHLSTLLSQALLAFTIEYEVESSVPLALCANALRVLGEKSVSASEIPRLTGGSPETSGIGWQHKPFVVVATDPARGRGKFVRLSPLGLTVQTKYFRLVSEIENRWEKRIGTGEIRRLRKALERLFTDDAGSPPPILAALVPPEGVARAGAPAASLGSGKVGSAARQRMRDVITQTEAFLRDPAGTLPHYPLWDMNRGFGP